MAETPLSAALTHLRTGDTAISTFGDSPYPHKFSTSTCADVFDVVDGTSQLHRALDEPALNKLIKVG